MAQFPFDATQSEVVPQPRREAACHSTMLRVKFPRVQVQADRLFFIVADEPDRPPRVPLWQEAKIGPTSEWSALTCKGECGHRKFNQASRRGIDDERKPWGIRHSIAWVPHWENAGVIGEAEFMENLESPCRGMGDRKTGRPVAANLSAPKVFQQQVDSSGVLPKLCGRH